MKIKIGPIPYLYPIPITLLGALVQGRPNFATIGDVGLIGIKPLLVSVSSHIEHNTNRGILAHGVFSMNFPTTAMLREADYCGNVSGEDVDKSELFEVFFGELENAPLIAGCPVNIECRVIKEFSIEHRQVFVGEVVQTHIAEEFVTEKENCHEIASLPELDPIIYALDNRYYRIGEAIGWGYQEGHALE